MTRQFAILNIIQDQVAPVTSVRPNAYNPNRQSDDEFLLLCKSIVEDGFTDAIIVNQDWTIIDGEHRWTAALVLNHLQKNNIPMTLASTAEWRKKRDQIIDPELTLPVKVLDKDDIQRRISTQRHNKARGHDDMELAAQMMRELEALGGLDAVMEGLDMTDEEVERLLSYGDSILDHFPSEEPSLAWEPRVTQPGQVKSWEDPESNQAQSVSRAAAQPVAPPPPTYEPAGAVPGLATNPLAPKPAAERPPLMARRIYIMLEDEARIVDRALGKDSASTLVQMCREKLGEAA